MEDAFIRKDDGSLDPNRSTLHIRYETRELQAVQTETVKRMTHLVLLPEGRRDLPAGAINAYMAELMLSTLLPLLQIVLSFKHGAYMDEDEFRFLETHRMDQPHVQSRVRSGSEVKYREFDGRSRILQALVEIRIGPAADFEAAAQLARDCLPTGVSSEIIRSEIPYRTS